MNYKNIIWDWNGTIVDDAWLFVQIMNKILKKNQLSLISLDDYKQNFCFPIQKYWRGLGFRFTTKSFNKLNANFIKQYQKAMFSPKIHRGMISFLKKIQKQNVKQFVLSASEESLLKNSIHFYKLGSLFDGVYGVDNLNAAGKETLGTVLFETEGLKLSETLMIGDTEYDYVVAKHIGCDVILIAHGHINYNRLLKTGVPIVSSLSELGVYLK